MSKSYELNENEYIDDKSLVHSKDGSHTTVYDEIENQRIIETNPTTSTFYYPTFANRSFRKYSK